MKLFPAYRSSYYGERRPMIGLLEMCTCGHLGYEHNRLSTFCECMTCLSQERRRSRFQSTDIVADALHALFPTD